MTSPAAPLADILILDLTRALAGPHATMMLGDLGARIIKVEAPGRGDDTRGWGPPFAWPESSPLRDIADRESTYFLSANRNKESIALDLKADEDRALLLSLLRRADVVVENFRPGVLERLGLGIDEMHRQNPGLVVLSISGFGSDGPEFERAGYDQIMQGEAGLMSITGGSPDDPQKVGVPIADLLAGMYGAFGTVAALRARERTGRGSVVRTSLLAAVIGVHAFQGTRWTVAGEVPRAEGNHHPSISPYGLYRCGDGTVQIAIGSESLWRTFAAAFGLDADDPGLATNADRVGHRTALIAQIEQAFSTWSTDALIERLQDLGIPAGRIRSIDQVYEWPQVESQGLIVEVEHETLGTLRLPGPAVRFFDTDGTETTRRMHAAPPVLDADGARIRSWLHTGEASDG